MRPTRSRLATLALLVAAVVLLLPAALSRKRRTAEEPAVVAAEPCPAPDGALLDLQVDGGGGKQVPRKPAPWQKPGPCSKADEERELFGACYVEITQRPPCGPKSLEHNGMCYRPIARAQTIPTSIQQ